MNNIKYLFILFVPTVILTSCFSSGDDDFWDDLMDYESTAYVTVDNAADTLVDVTITSDDTTIELSLSSYTTEEIELPYGKYHVLAETVTDSLVVDEDFELDEDDYEYAYNLNLTKEDYIVENSKYTAGTDYSALLEELEHEFEYEGEVYKGYDAYVIKGALVVPETWDYNLDEEAPDEVTITGGGNSTTRSKLWRAEYFVTLLELAELLENYEEYGDEIFEDYEDEEDMGAGSSF